MAKFQGVMRAVDMPVDADIHGWYMSEKYDGVRAYWDGSKLWTRTGKEIHAPAWWLPKTSIALDGELWIARGTFQWISSVVRKLQPIDNEWIDVKYMVFDAPEVAGNFAYRKYWLEGNWKLGHYVRIVNQVRCLGLENLQNQFKHVLSLGGEGIVLRNPQSLYVTKKSKDFLRLKPVYDAEAIVLGYIEGKGKYAGQVGALKCRDRDVCFEVGSGLTDAQRKSPPPIGTTITYQFRGRTNGGLPRQPTFLRVRDDDPGA
jgi:DNA ligase-1